MQFKKGDRVKIISEFHRKHHRYRCPLVCSSDERDLCGSKVVAIENADTGERVNAAFDTDFLQIDKTPTLTRITQGF